MIFKKFKRRKKPFKQDLIIEQNKEKVHIEGLINRDKCEITQLVLKNREKEIQEDILIENEVAGQAFKFTINLLTQEELLEDSLYDLYITTRWKKTDVPEKRQLKLSQIITYKTDADGIEYVEYPIRLGRFVNTDFKELVPYYNNEYKYEIYTTVKGSLSFSTKENLNQKTNAQIDILKMKDDYLEINGKVFTKSNIIEGIYLQFKSRQGEAVLSAPLSYKFLKTETSRRFGLRRYRYRGKLNFTENIEMLKEDIYDAFLLIKYKEMDPIEIRLGTPRYRARIQNKSSYAKANNSVFVASSYYTFRMKNLSLQIDEFSPQAYEYLEKALKRPKFYNRFKKEDVWIVGERRDKAQDTGYRFFKYMRENHPEQKVYYVIDENSEELKNVKPYGNILYFKTKDHIEKLLQASKIIGSHHPDYLYPLRTKEFENKLVAKKVFLQHGVIGTKNMKANYGKNAKGFDTDLFLVSSQLEKEIIVNDLEYDKEEVKITGLSRFDDLFTKDIPTKNQLLIIPTWREWLSRDDYFLNSQYYERYQNLLLNERLEELSKQYNFEIVFCLHPNMQRYAHLFETSHVKQINQGEVDVQDLLKESAMMVTDYSSVAFDFSFLDKPVTYYQFDRNRFIGRKGSHLDLNNDLPGDIINELDDLLDNIEQYAKNNFQIKEINRLKSKKFLKYKDRKSSERIYQEIKDFKPKNQLKNKILKSETYDVLFKRFRKSKRYFPIMKLSYKIMRRYLPVDDKLIIFESGLGKQYADSPKIIYEELVKRDLGYNFVWISNKHIPFRNLNTKRVLRLSPSYYYYLARAKYWVNNQNFPKYIEKGKDTIYLQTWHGTPLKKMLNDLDHVIGRSDDYLESTTRLANDWDYLISPSKYATEKFTSAFKYKNNIIETGYPRNDIFYDVNQNKKITNLKNKLNIPSDKKVVLYAPTFRDNEKSKNKFTLDFQMDLEKMQERLGEDYIILVRLHVIVKNNLKIPRELREFVKNVSNYADMQDLLLISDVLITDYSSSMFDFANTKKPMLFYTYDLEEYRDNIRGFYIDFESEAPGPLLYNTEEIITSLENIEEVKSNYHEKYNKFVKKYCEYEDGQATGRVINKLFTE